MAASAGFAASVTVTGEVATILVRGDADLAARADFATALDQALESDAPTIVLDARGLSYLESACLRALLHARMNANEQGRRFVVRGVQGIVRRVLDVAGVTDLLVEDG
jgi:anti-anti-sigma factor